MNGLEAIELMKQGREVVEYVYGVEFIYKIINNSVCYKVGNGKNIEFELSTGFHINGTYEEYKPNPVTGWERVPEECVYYWIADDRVDCDDELGYDHIYDSANYFSTREKAEEINFKQTLFRKLQRFSDENGGNEIDWNNDLKGKWFIVYGHDLSNNKKLYADNYVSRQFVGTVYFISREVAEQAIELFHDDLIKYFTGDFGGKG